MPQKAENSSTKLYNFPSGGCMKLSRQSSNFCHSGVVFDLARRFRSEEGPSDASARSLPAR
eukprot:m.446888 g.446888  ORF g.446888 m.446888 type:complete len:61 (-) comp19435_c0_seq1:1348-1530(-)